MAHGNRTGTHTSWTPREVAIASDPTISLHEMARQTGRTYQAVADFRRDNGLAISVDHPSHRTARTPAPVLCPCGALDGDHEDWCPDGR